MNPFDVGILRFLNSFVGRSTTFDALVILLSSNILIKGVVFGILFWWAWFQRPERDSVRNREILISGYTLSTLGVVFGRVIAHLAPFRERPLRIAELQIALPADFHRTTLQDWSSFPSDHAALYVAISTTLFLVWRRAGIFAYLYTLIVLSLPRVLLGIHYPTDILAGAVLGMIVGLVATLKPVRHVLAGPGLRYSEFHPGVFYGAIFLLTYVIATVCEPILGISDFTRTLVSAIAVKLGLGSGVTATPQSIVEPIAVVLSLVSIVIGAEYLRRRRERDRR